MFVKVAARSNKKREVRATVQHEEYGKQDQRISRIICGHFPTHTSPSFISFIHTDALTHTHMRAVHCNLGCSNAEFNRYAQLSRNESDVEAAEAVVAPLLFPFFPCHPVSFSLWLPLSRSLSLFSLFQKSAFLFMFSAPVSHPVCVCVCVCVSGCYFSTFQRYRFKPACRGKTRPLTATHTHTHTHTHSYSYILQAHN